MNDSPSIHTPSICDIAHYLLECYDHISYYGINTVCTKLLMRLAEGSVEDCVFFLNGTGTAPCFAEPYAIPLDQIRERRMVWYAARHNGTDIIRSLPIGIISSQWINWYDEATWKQFIIEPPEDWRIVPWDVIDSNS